MARVLIHTISVRTSALAILATAAALLILTGLAPAAGAEFAPLLTPEPTGGEQCGNCADDDADGLTDAEDPDCCPLMGTLDVRRVRADGGRLDLRALLPAGLDPMGHEVQAIVSREAGPLVCRDVVPAPRARGWGRRAGRVVLRRAAQDRWALHVVEEVDAAPIGALRVTLRVGEACLGAIAIVEPPNGSLLP